MSPKTPSIAVPTGGRICERNLSKGHLVVGIIHLPEDFVPQEGVAYGMVQRDGQLMVVKEAVSGPLSNQHQTSGIGDLLCAPIWNKTLDANSLTVRFIKAFPSDNVWGVYGASHYNLPDSAPGHAWCDISPRGYLRNIDPPFDATGEAVGQLLSSHAVWPDKTGELYSIPQLQSSVRPHYHQYHTLLVSAARDPEIFKHVKEHISKNPHFYDISMGPVDHDYCVFLSKLEERGLLCEDAPQTAAQKDERERVVMEIMTGGAEDDIQVAARRPRP